MNGPILTCRSVIVSPSSIWIRLSLLIVSGPDPCDWEETWEAAGLPEVLLGHRVRHLHGRLLHLAVPGHLPPAPDPSHGVAHSLRLPPTLPLLRARASLLLSWPACPALPLLPRLPPGWSSTFPATGAGTASNPAHTQRRRSEDERGCSRWCRSGGRRQPWCDVAQPDQWLLGVRGLQVNGDLLPPLRCLLLVGHPRWEGSTCASVEACGFLRGALLKKLNWKKSSATLNFSFPRCATCPSPAELCLTIT